MRDTRSDVHTLHMTLITIFLLVSASSALTSQAFSKTYSINPGDRVPPGVHQDLPDTAHPEAVQYVPKPRSAFTAALKHMILTGRIESSSQMSAEIRNSMQRWYASILRQQQIISERVEEMRDKLNKDLLSTQEFLDEVNVLFERANRLYTLWKKCGILEPPQTYSNGAVQSDDPSTGKSDVGRPEARMTRHSNAFVASLFSSPQMSQPHGPGASIIEGATTDRSNLLATSRSRLPEVQRSHGSVIPQTKAEPALDIADKELDPSIRKDTAVGKSLNYLRLSLANFLLGYCDSDGRQIADAEKQARLSKLWRTRSLLFMKTLDL